MNPITGNHVVKVFRLNEHAIQFYHCGEGGGDHLQMFSCTQQGFRMSDGQRHRRRNGREHRRLGQGMRDG